MSRRSFKNLCAVIEKDEDASGNCVQWVLKNCCKTPVFQMCCLHVQRILKPN